MTSRAKVTRICDPYGAQDRPINGIDWIHELLTDAGEKVFTCSYNSLVPAERATKFSDSRGAEAIIGTVAEIELNESPFAGLKLANHCRFLTEHPYKSCDICSNALRPWSYREEPRMKLAVLALDNTGKLEQFQFKQSTGTLAKARRCRTCKAEYIPRDFERSSEPLGFDKIRHCFAFD